MGNLFQIILLATFFLIVTVVVSIPLENNKQTALSEEAKQYLEELNVIYLERANAQITARWNYATQVTDETAQASAAANTAFLKYQADIRSEIIERFPNSEGFEDEVKRELQYLRIQGSGDMPENNVNKMNELLIEMERSYASTTVCRYNTSENNCEVLRLEDIEEQLRTKTDFAELEHYFTGWHNEVNERISADKYAELVELQNEMARANGFKDMSEMWIAPYIAESSNWSEGANQFKLDMLKAWDELKDIYATLAEYVTIKLKDTSYASKITSEGLPANIFGSMWAQDWSTLDALTKPYPEVPSLDVTKAMLAKGYTVQKMREISEDYYVSLGLQTYSFWDKSMFERPENVEFICQPSAVDFYKDDDFRIKMCANVNMKDLSIMQRQMGHVQYFQQYKSQHYIFRRGANPGFQAAVGDAVAIAFTNPYHLQCQLDLDLEIPDLCTAQPTTTEDSGQTTTTEGPIPSSTEGSTIGSSEGSTIGSTEGSTVGSTESSTVDSTEGSTVGSTEGSTVGSTEGSTVGSTEGSTVGSTEGSTVGLTEGSTVGSTEGSTVGSTEGSTVGSTEGSTVGSTEGSTIGSTEGSTAGSTEGSTAGSTEGSTAGSTEGSTAGSTEGSTAGSTEGSTAGSTEGSTAGSTAGSTEGSTAGSTEGSTAGSTEGSTVGSTENSIFSKAEGGLFAKFALHNVFADLGQDGHKATNGVNEIDQNFLFLLQLQKYAFIPFGIAIEDWRWKVFSGEIKKEDYNKKWWEIRKQFQGIVPPAPRPDAAFDPAANYHIAANIPSIGDFVSHILQFQFYEAMCKEAGEYDPNNADSHLFKCNLNGKEAVGPLLSNMMQLGFSKHWTEALKIITGKETLDVSSIKSFYAPIVEEMKEYIENSKKGDDDDGSNTAAIIVGCILGAAVVVVVIGYFIGKRMKK